MIVIFGQHYVESSPVILSLPTVWVVSHQHLILDVEGKSIEEQYCLAEENA
jgi:hypothetical protein